VVEQGPIDQLFRNPQHPYTAGLLASIPRVGQGTRLDAIRGNVPPLDKLPTGCRFHPRCDYAVAGRCNAEPPELVTATNGSTSRCVRVGELTLKGVEEL
jgi:oligopeptide/dipeptide ABC transporter ATP-binding protein